jgi:hypothetical protein
MKNKFSRRVFFVILSLNMIFPQPEGIFRTFRPEAAIAASVTIDDLINAIKSAQNLYDNAVEGTAAGNYEAGAKNELQNAIDQAKAKKNYYDSQNDASVIAPAITNLNNAVDVFNQKRITPDKADADGDGVLDTIDNCQFSANPSQEDADIDGIGDACDSIDNRDTMPPMITLLGPASVDVILGAVYSDIYGAEAHDNVDGDISKNIIFDSSAVDTSAAGSYTVTYNVKDAAGNPAAEVTRTVRVISAADEPAKNEETNETDGEKKEDKDAGDTSNSSEDASRGGGTVFFVSKFAVPDAKISINSGNEKTANRNVALAITADGATMMAIANNAEFSDGEWEAFSPSKEWTLPEGNGEKTVYVRFRSASGKYSAVYTDSIILEEKTGGYAGRVLGDDTVNVLDGDLIQCKNSSDPSAVYVVKSAGDKKFIRLIKPDFFRHYTHVSPLDIVQFNTLNGYTLSNLVRINTGANNTPKPTDRVYEINGDQTRHWLRMTKEQFNARGGSEEAIFSVNSAELKSYEAGDDVVPISA